MCAKIQRMGIKSSPKKAKPFLKWAGGKTQLLTQIAPKLPPKLATGAITRYVEPFVGSGAVFFWLAQQFPQLSLHIVDRNEELILAYKTVQRHCAMLIERLSEVQEMYHQLGPAEQKDHFYATRAAFNAVRLRVDLSQAGGEAAERTAQLIFLNRTCFNGLFRVNSKGEFNVPFGSYKNPRICDPANLRAVADVLQRTEIRAGDFTRCRAGVDEETFVYFDPPYRPLSQTASFTAYAQRAFNDDEQRRLAEFYRELDARGAVLMLSNSDPRNTDPHDNFFDQLYAGYAMHRVRARRIINSKAERRGEITELLITNYEI